MKVPGNRLVETWECFFVDAKFNRVSPGHPEAIEINAWFFHDWKPLTAADVEHALTGVKQGDIMAFIFIRGGQPGKSEIVI